MDIKPRGYWTKEKCQEEALKYESRNEFKLNSGGAYNAAKRNSWLVDICLHIDIIKKPQGYWTKEKCTEEALKYKSRIEFRLNSFNVYETSKRNNWIDDICIHMINKIKPIGYWTKELCQNEALKYTIRNEFKLNSGGAYYFSLKNKWLDEICIHMPIIGNKYLRCIYAYEFNDNKVYVGLTFNLKKRNIQHLNNIKSQVYKHIINCNNNYIIKQLTEYINVDDAIKMEEYYVNFYKENGWYILNKANTGAIGGNELKWTKEKCIEEALKYDTKNEFRLNSLSYNTARREKWLNEICKHMIMIHKPKGYWSKYQCHIEALKYSNRSDFMKNSVSAYSISHKNKWLTDICGHMTKLK